MIVRPVTMRSSNCSPLTYCQSDCIIKKTDMTVKPDTIGWPSIHGTRQRKKLYLTYYKRSRRSCEVKKILTIINSLISPVFLLFVCPHYLPFNWWRKRGTIILTTHACSRYLVHIMLCGKELVASIATASRITNLHPGNPWPVSS